MARLLCVGEDTQSLEFRCAVLQRAGYHATPASVPEAETFLRTEHFDLVIVSAWLQEGENEKVVTSAGKTPTPCSDQADARSRSAGPSGAAATESRSNVLRDYDFRLFVLSTPAIRI
jgi:hypothetical protein